ncbi:MAG: hypothetical protein LBE85_08435 [Candidatus Accumulibacter sp.]|jgi:predicted peptidase|nr:hypothetical protein [Accumulibacter sp.]
MKQGRGLQWVPLFALLAAFGGGCGGGSSSSSSDNDIDADKAIAGIQTIGFVAADGAKLSAIAVEYDTDLTGANIDKNTYDVWQYKAPWNDNCVNYGGGEIGDITKIYVNDRAEISAEGGSGKGSYVIIEVYTGYQYAAEQSFSQALSASVTQKAEIKTAAQTINPGTAAVTNYKESESCSSYTGQCTQSYTANSGTYTILGIDGYKYFTHVTNTDYPVDGGAFVAEDCFDEQTGAYKTVQQSYALYVPADYEKQKAEGKRFALVTVDHPAASEATHPFTQVVQSRGPSYFVSDEAQQIIKDKHGLGGLIVVVPVVTARVGDNAGTPGGFPSLVKLWDHLADNYAIDPDHVYGAGQSVGGMVLLETNTKRDNYFAGILLYDNQWAQNYYKDEVFVRGMATATNETAANTPRHYPSTDGSIIWDYHWGDNGEQVFEGHDSNNYYYLTSDDNIMITNSLTGNALSVNTWVEQNYLYEDLAGYEIPRFIIGDFKAGKDEQNFAIKNFLDPASQTQGIWWITFQGGGNQITPIWSRSLDATYEWLLTQTRETEMKRPKLDLDKPFMLASTQDMTRVVPGFTKPDQSGDPIYYKTGKAGSGTRFYNTSWLNLGAVADQIPGWLPGAMSHPVTAASMKGVQTVSSSGGRLVVAIEYDVDMKNAVIHRKGDKVLDSKGNPRDDDFVSMDTFDFYDANDEKIPGTINRIYIKDSAEADASLGHAQGSGRYVIVEIDTASSANAVKVVQRATIRTDKAMAAATPSLLK